MRKKHPASLKFKVALKALTGQPVSDLCKNYDLASSVVHKWKNQLQKSGPEVFSTSKKSSTSITKDQDKEKLYQQIGKMSVELEYLKKVLGD